MIKQLLKIINNLVKNSKILSLTAVFIITKYNKFYNSNKEAPITLLLNGEERKFLLEKDLFEKLQGKSEININIKKGCLGICYGVGMQE